MTEELNSDVMLVDDLPDDKVDHQETEQKEIVNPIDLDKTVEFVNNPIIDIVADADADEHIRLDIPANLPKHEKASFDAIRDNKSQVAGNSNDAYNWASAYSNAARMHGKTGTSDEALNREGADWHQGIKFGKLTYNVVQPKLNGQGTGHRLVGEAAVSAFGSALSRTRSVTIPLPSCGFWISMRAPSLTEDISLDETIAAEKITLGRITGGVAWSQASVYTVKHMVNFIIDHATKTNLDTLDRKVLLDTMLVTDIEALGRGLLSARYARGYPIQRPCTYNPEKCTEVVKQQVDFNRMLIIDNAMYTEPQKSMIARLQDRMTVEDVNKFKAGFAYNDGTQNVFELSPTIKVVLAVPTIAKFIQAGEDWIGGLKELANQALLTEPGKERDTYIYRQGLATSACQFSSWVKEIRIYVGDEGDYQVIDDYETICTTLAEFSGEKSLVGKLRTAVTAFTATTTLSVFGVPNYTCKCCGNAQVDPEHVKHAVMVPLDIIEVFMTLVNLRIQAIKNIQNEVF